MKAMHRIGIIGFGYIGSSLYRVLPESGIEVAGVYDRSQQSLAQLPQGIGTSDVSRFLHAAAALDLVVEVAHPQATVDLGEEILRRTDYMPCSVVALANDDLRMRLLSTAETHGNHLYIPHGAVAAMDNFFEARHRWKRAEVTFRKPPASIDQGGNHEVDEVVLFEGSARDIAEKFPRSVNAMVAFALATVGLDRTMTRIVADRRLGNKLVGEFHAEGEDGSRLSVFKEEPAVGVSSTGMVDSIRGSVIRALNAVSDGLEFV